MAWCARVEVTADPAPPCIRSFDDWGSLLPALEAHGLAPLAFARLRAAGVSVPPPAGPTLRGMYARHALAARRRFEALARILAAFDAAGLDAIVLKGAALAHLIYPAPGLRPMGDLDLLIPADRVDPARAALAESGFRAIEPADTPTFSKHLVAVGTVEGFPVRIELHHRLFAEDRGRMLPADPWATRCPLPIGAYPASCLGREMMLWHLCQHLTFHADVFTRIRLIWIADIAGFAERFVDEIDWPQIQQQFPLVPRVLSLVHRVTPLSDKLQGKAARAIGTAGMPASEFWGDFQGWPRYSVGALRARGRSPRQILGDTFLPPRWWLRLHYGRAATDALAWQRWVCHPAEVMGRLGGHLAKCGR